MNTNKMLKSLLSVGIATSTLFLAGNVVTLAEKADSVLTASNVQTDDFPSFEKYGEDWLSSLTDNERSAIIYYTGENYTDINYYLRSNKKELKPDSTVSKSELDEKIKLIDSAIEKATLKEDVTVYRNTSEQEFGEAKDSLKQTLGLDLTSIEGIKNFDEYIQKAITIVQKNINKTNTALSYTSTSLLKKGAFGDKAICIEIKIPKGTHVPYVDSISLYKGEKELLLPRETKFKITGASTVQENGKNKLIIRAEVVK